MGILRRFFLSIVYVGVYATKASHIPQSPNIVFMFADDLGWSDVSFHGSKQIPTPNIDALARDGIILNQYYTQPTCSPSRGSLMTGKYPIRLGFQHEVLSSDQAWGLPLEEKILPQYFKSLQYSTHAVGKWHLGFFEEDYLPLNRGFDSFFGYYAGLEDYYTHFSREGNYTGLDLHCNNQDAWNYNGIYGTELFTTKAREVILEHNSEKPLFLYFSQQAPHSGNDEPLQVPEKYVKPLLGISDQERQKFAGMVQALDQSVGEIFSALDSSGMLNNTLFIFTTDNGGAVDGQDGTRGSNFPLRGTKYNLWEGGTRGTAFIWAEFLRDQSHIYNQLMHMSDWLPTLLSAAGGPGALEMLGNVDGFDQWPSLVQGLPSPRSEILLNFDDETNVKGLRKGRFKYVNGSSEGGKFDGWFDVEGKPIKNGISPPESLMKKREYDQTYMMFLNYSKVARILQRRYQKEPQLAFSCQTPECQQQLEIQCGLRPTTDTCRPNEGPCLFDLINDPCEFHNIAKELPEVRAEMERTIDMYRPYIVPEGYHPADPRSDPRLHGNAWKPWISTEAPSKVED